MKQSIKQPKLSVPGSKRVVDPIENNIALEDLVEFSAMPGKVGAALLSDGHDIQFCFGFKLTGIHPNRSEREFELIAQHLTSGLKTIPEGETLTVVQEVRPNNRNRLDYYRAMAEGAPNELFREMAKSAAAPGSYFEHRKERSIAVARGRYREKVLYLFVTATPNQQSTAKDKTEAFIRKAHSWAKTQLGKITGERYEDNPERLRAFFNGAQSIYESWETIIKSMRLMATPMTVTDIAESMWREFNDNRPMREIPQLLYWDGENLRSEFREAIHLSSWLFDSQAISVPRAHRDYVYRNYANGLIKFTNVLTLRHKPSEWPNPKEQLLYLYDKLEGIEEYRIVATFTRASDFIVTKNVELLQRQAKDAVTHAERRGLPSTRSNLLQEEANRASTELYKGNLPVRMSLCLVISGWNRRNLGIQARSIQSRFPLPATIELERDYVPVTWMQSFPLLSYRKPLFKPFDRARIFTSNCVPAFMPIVKVESPDPVGLEFSVEGESVPYYLDIVNVHRHIMLLATTRAGKSVLFAQILLSAICSNIPMVVVDYPKEDGDSTFGPITQLAGKDGAYLNIAEESNNFLQLPNLSRFDAEEKERRLIEAKDYALDILLIILLGGQADNLDREGRVTKSLLSNFLNLFYADETIKARFEAAENADIGSTAWRNVPTLHDYANFCTQEKLSAILEVVSPEHVTLVNEIRLRLQSFVETTVGRSLSEPTSIPKHAKLLVFAFKSVSSNEDAAILMASASAAAMRRTLEAPASILFLDEVSILSKFSSLMAQVAKISANGAKSGIRLMMAMQTPASIAKSDYKEEILGNISTYLVGRIKAPDASNYSRILDIPPEIVARNASKAFYPVAADLYSNWLIIEGGDHTFVRSYAPPLLLAAVANNPNEEIAKAAFLRAYENPTDALKAFARELIAAAREGRALQYPTSDKLDQHTGEDPHEKSIPEDFGQLNGHRKEAEEREATAV